EILRQKLAPLDAPAREALELAAVFGVEVEESALESVWGRGRAALEEAVAAGVRAGVLAEAGEGRVRFRHALLREALYAELARPRRAALHAAVAARLSSQHPPPTLEIAHHAIEAGPGERYVERVTVTARELGGRARAPRGDPTHPRGHAQGGRAVARDRQVP